MKIKELLKMQLELDDLILAKVSIKNGIEMDHSDFIVERILALQVEVSELANATRCFKYWSKKESESKETVLAEYADCLHFLLSIGNTLRFTAEEIEDAYLTKYAENIERQHSGY